MNTNEEGVLPFPIATEFMQRISVRNW